MMEMMVARRLIHGSHDIGWICCVKRRRLADVGRGMWEEPDDPDTGGQGKTDAMFRVRLLFYSGGWYGSSRQKTYFFGGNR